MNSDRNHSETEVYTKTQEINICKELRRKWRRNIFSRKTQYSIKIGSRRFMHCKNITGLIFFHYEKFCSDVYPTLNTNKQNRTNLQNFQYQQYRIAL